MKAEVVKVHAGPAPHDPAHRIQVDMTFDCRDPRSDKERPLRIQKTAPAGCALDSAVEWAKQNAKHFLAEVLGKSSSRENPTMPQPRSLQGAKPKVEVEPHTETTIKATTVTVADMFERMEDRVIRHEEPTSQETWRSVWNCHLKATFGEMPLQVVTKSRILDFREELQKRYAPSTCNHIVAKLQGILSYAVEKGILVAVPRIRRLRIQAAAEKDPYTDEEMLQLLGAAEGDEVGSLALLLSLDAGLRRNEMLALRWCDVDLKSNEIHIKHSLHRTGLKCPKGKKAVSVPMRARLRTALVQARRDRKLTDHVFQGERNAWMSESAFRNYMRDLAAKAGVEWKGFHKGKHTFITMLLEKGATLNELQLLARHKHASTTEGYMHVRHASKAMRAGIARLEDPEPAPAPTPGPGKSVLSIVRS